MSRLSSRLVSVVAAAATTTLFTISTGKKAQVKRIMATNRNAADSFLRIGYVNVVAGAFVQVLPDILLISGVDMEMWEDLIPVSGNDVDGFIANTDAAAGCTGVIVCQCSAAAAAPNDVQVTIEVEER